MSHTQARVLSAERDDIIGGLWGPAIFSTRRDGARFAAFTIFPPSRSSTVMGEGRGKPGADDTRTGPEALRGGRAGAVPAAELHSPARSRPARRRGHPAGRLPRAGGGEPAADAD